MKQKQIPRGPLLKFCLIDLVIIVAALIGSFFIRFQEIRAANISIYTALFIPLVLVRLATFFSFHLYDFSRKYTQFDIIYFTFWASVVAHTMEFLAILYTERFIQSDHQISRYIFLLNFTLSWWGAAGWRLLYLKRRQRWSYDRTRLLIVGAGSLAESVQQDIEHYSKLGHEVIGLVEDDIESPNPDTPILGSMNDLSQLVEQHDIDEIIVTSQTANRKELLDILSRCRNTGCIVRMLPEMYEVMIGQVEIGQVAGIPLITVDPEVTDDLVLIGKYSFDFLFATLFSLALFPLVPLIALAIKLGSRGPVLYKQQRVGKDGRLFTMYKFRTMKTDAETGTGPVLSWQEDPRVTPIGRFLRRWRLDETPQLINVLKGEMSLVGPRPERPHFVEQYKKEILSYEVRESVRPGVTGLAQIHGFYNSPVEHKLRYDLAYINNMSLLLDLKILFNTIRVVVSGSGIAE